MTSTELAAHELKLRPVRVDDEQALVAAHGAMMASDDFAMMLHYDAGKPFSDYVVQCQNLALGVDMPDGLVPDTSLVAVVEGAIVGRVSIRHRLNDFLAHEAGHIGYGVLEQHRRRGYATEILRQSLTIARSLGIESAMLTCNDDNVGSATVIERCGGVLRDRVTASSGVTKRRYDIALL